MKKRIVVLGSGAMGSALGHCMVGEACEVWMVLLPYDGAVREACVEGGGEGGGEGRGEHPGLGMKLDRGLVWCESDEVNEETWEGCDVVVVAVSSEGLGWAEKWLLEWADYFRGVVFATKGLPTYKPSLCFFEGVKGREGKAISVSVLGGPCLARELAGGEPTSLVVASREGWLCEEVRGVMESVSHVSMEVSTDFEGVAWCAALKNLYAIGVSAGEKEGRRNGVAGLFSQSVKEMVYFLGRVGGDGDVVSGLAGVGDLYVTVGGGRNGRFGRLLGEGLSRDEIMGSLMRGVTVEGVHTAMGLMPFLADLEREGRIDWDYLPLMRALLLSLVEGKKFECPPWIV